MGKLFSIETYKVAKIVNDRCLVITGGKYSGFHVGDCFEIFDTGTDVFDPDNGRKIGSLEYVKATVKAIQVYDEMTACTNTLNEASTLNSLAAALSSKNPAALDVSPEDISGGIDRKIHVGDLVRKIEKDFSDKSGYATDPKLD